MHNDTVTTREIVSVMLGNKLTVSQVVSLLVEKHGDVESRLVRNRIFNMTKSNSVKIDFELDGCVKKWHLISVDDAYFRSSSLTRHLRRGRPALKQTKKGTGRIYRRPDERVSEINACRLANAVLRVMATGVWVAPELLPDGQRKQKGEAIQPETPKINALSCYTDSRSSVPFHDRSINQRVYLEGWR